MQGSVFWRWTLVAAVLVVAAVVGMSVESDGRNREILIDLRSRLDRQLGIQSHPQRREEREMLKATKTGWAGAAHDELVFVEVVFRDEGHEEETPAEFHARFAADVAAAMEAFPDVRWESGDG